MDKTRFLAHSFFAIFCAFFLSCKSFAEPVNLALLKQEVMRYHDSGNYNQELTQVINAAQQYINQRSAAATTNNSKKLAIVLDIDETSLTNYDKIRARNFAGDQQLFHQENLAANSPAIAPMLTLYHNALAHKVAVFFVTGRPQSEYHATEKNLKKVGFNHWTGLYLKPENYSQQSIVPFKSNMRKTITDQGYTIIASIGDQQSDLTGGYAEKTFKLPNPFYHIP